MTSSLVRICLLVTLALLGACAHEPPRIQTTVNHDPRAQFTGLRTWAWLPDDAIARAGSDKAVARIKRAVERQLSAKGYSLVPRDQADFVVGYRLSVDTEVDVKQIADEYGYGGPQGYWTDVQENRPQTYEKGTLILDVVNPQNMRLLWRGTASARLEPTNAPREGEKGQQAVETLLAKFPPQ
jgi:hypothetical protein